MDGSGQRACRHARSSIQELVKAYVEAQSNDEASSTAAVEGLEATVQFQADGESFPFGTTIVVVAIDRDTGVPTIERFVSVDDVGNVVNPVLVEGQLIGGAVQGIGETLWEEVAFDGSGQPLSGTLMEYAAPRAEWLPHFELDRTVTPSPNNPLGVKGVGEAGTVHAAPTIAACGHGRAPSRSGSSRSICRSRRRRSGASSTMVELVFGRSARRLT